MLGCRNDHRLILGDRISQRRFHQYTLIKEWPKEILEAAAALTGRFVKFLFIAKKEGGAKAESQWSETALQAIAEGCHRHFEVWLLARTSERGQAQPVTALQASSLEGHADIVRLLLDPRWKAHTSSVDYRTAVLSAARRGHRESISLLLEFGYLFKTKHRRNQKIGRFELRRRCRPADA